MEPPHRDPVTSDGLTETDAYTKYSKQRLAKVCPDYWNVIGLYSGTVPWGWFDAVLGGLCVLLQTWATDPQICYIRRDFGKSRLKDRFFREFDMMDVARFPYLNLSARDTANKEVQFIQLQKYTHLRGEVEMDMGPKIVPTGVVLDLGELALRVARPRRVLEVAFKAHGHDIFNAKHKYVFDDEVGPLWEAQMILWFRRYGDAEATEVEIRWGHREPMKAKLQDTGEIIHQMCLRRGRHNNVMVTLLEPVGETPRRRLKTYLHLTSLYMWEKLTGV